jgi:hypothetical protein
LSDLDDVQAGLKRVEADLQEFAVKFLRKAGQKVSQTAISEGGNMTPESIERLEIAGYIVTLIKGSSVPYAAVHEFGINERVAVFQHTRTITKAFGKTIPKKDVTVRSHMRKMNIAKRAYLSPALQDELPRLQEMATNDLIGFVSGALG